jgi:hypothetical protein
MHMTATLVKWYEEHGRHEVYASGKSVPLPSTTHSLALDECAVNAVAQTGLQQQSIPTTAREEKIAARLRNRDGRNGLNRNHRPGFDGKAATGKALGVKDAGYHQNMAKLYRQQVLKEQPTIQIQRLHKEGTDQT